MLTSALYARKSGRTPLLRISWNTRNTRKRLSRAGLALSEDVDDGARDGLIRSAVGSRRDASDRPMDTEPPTPPDFVADPAVPLPEDEELHAAMTEGSFLAWARVATAVGLFPLPGTTFVAPAASACTSNDFPRSSTPSCGTVEAPLLVVPGAVNGRGELWTPGAAATATTVESSAGLRAAEEEGGDLRVSSILVR